MILYVDLETYCEVPINNGTHAYAEKAEVLLTQYAIDNGPVKVVDGLCPQLSMLIEMADRVVIHSKDDFDRIVLKYQGVEIPHEKIDNTAVQALSHGLPAGLDKLCTIMKVDADLAKDKHGKQLIQLFCKPPPKNAKRGRATKHTHPVEWTRFRDQYAPSDILAMREIYRKMPRVNYPGSERERQLYCLDLRMNDRGMKIDRELAVAAIDTVAQAKKIMDKRTKEMTNEQLRSTTQRDELLRVVLGDYGVSLPDLQSSTLERRLEDPDLPAGARELLAMRLQTSTTSNAKYNRLLKAVSNDGRLRGSIQFCGAARTKRWSGRIFQPQNLPRPDPEFTEEKAFSTAVDVVLSGAGHLLYDEPIKVCSNLIRGVIIASEGCKLVVSDLEQVEARILPWLAGEKWKLAAFAAYDHGEGFDNYVMAYSRAFGVASDDVDKSQRQIGKTTELSAGYGGAYAAWVSMAATLHAEIPERGRVLEIVRAWREAHPALCDWETGLWAQLDRAARLAIQNPGRTFEAGEHIRFERWREWLRMELPSGGFLNYAAPAIIDDPRRTGFDTVSYMGVNNYTKKWERLTTYGGKLSADATQATARELMAENLPAIEAAGYLPILLVHDEVLTEVPEDRDDLTAEGLNSLLARQPAWAAGLPLAAGGFEAYRYRKE
jgi:DNA polymerase